jgi:ribosomal small subunit protein bTHX
MTTNLIKRLATALPPDPLFINRNSNQSTKFYYFCSLCNLAFTIKLRYIMGKGDKKSKRGKIIRGSFGVRRKRKAKKSVVAAMSEKAVKAAEKAVTTAATEAKAARPVKAAKPKAPAKSPAKPVAKKTETEPVTVTEKAAKPAAKAKKPAAKKEEE